MFFSNKKKKSRSVQKLKEGNTSQEVISFLSNYDLDLPKDTIQNFKDQLEELRTLSDEEIEKLKEEHFGRPTKYDPKMCAMLLEEMAKGKSKETVATELGITYHTLNNWEKNNVDFFNALKIGEQLCRRWWVEQGRVNLNNKDFKHVLWMMNMTNMHGWIASNNRLNAKIEARTEHIERKVVEFKNGDAGMILQVLADSGALGDILKGVMESNDVIEGEYEDVEDVEITEVDK